MILITIPFLLRLRWMPVLDLTCGICRDDLRDGERYAVCQSGCQKLLHEACIQAYKCGKKCPFCKEGSIANQLKLASKINLIIEVFYALSVCGALFTLVGGILWLLWWLEDSRFERLLKVANECRNISIQ